MIRTTLFIFIFAIVPAGGLFGQAVTSISEIQEQPSAYAGDTVTVEGFVTEHETSSATDSTVFYLKGRGGTTLRVRTARLAPGIGHRFAISGPLKTDAGSEVYLVEQARSQLQNLHSPSSMAGEHSYRLWVYGLGGAVVLAVLGLVSMIVFLVRREDERNRRDESVAASVRTERGPVSSEGEVDRVVENDTLKMHVPPEDEWTVLPGRLLVKSGLDDISEIRFYRSEGQRASPITFGRTEGSHFEHVQLKTPSVSNWQAKVVYDAEADRCKLVNYAIEENKPTRVNGRPLEESESVELKEGDTLEMGGIELEFTTS